MFKKIVCAAIMTALLVSQAVGAFAAEFTEVNTTTTYDATNKQISVTTTVSGVEKDDEITYLAYTGEDVTDESIAYIDQKTVTDADVTEGNVKFEYVADFKFNGSKVMVGGLDKSATEAYKVNANGVINANAKVTIGEKTYEIAPVSTDDGFTKIGAAVEGTTLSDGAADVTWFAAADGIWVANKALNGKAAVTLVWSGTAPEIATTPALGAVKNINKKLLVLATKAKGAAEYGIKVSKQAFAGLEVVDALAEDVTVVDLETKVVKYAALGTDADGNYVVAIDNLLADNVEYTVAAYSDTADTDAETITNVVATAAPEGAE